MQLVGSVVVASSLGVCNWDGSFFWLELVFEVWEKTFKDSGCLRLCLGPLMCPFLYLKSAC